MQRFVRGFGQNIFVLERFFHSVLRLISPFLEFSFLFVLLFFPIFIFFLLFASLGLIGLGSLSRVHF